MSSSHEPFGNLFEGFLQAAEDFPEHLALVVDGDHVTYAKLRDRACQLARTILKHDPETTYSLAAFLAYRSFTAYGAVLGILGAGKGYVPLHPGFPVERTWRMLERSGVRVLVVGKEGSTVLEELLSRVTRPLTVIWSDIEDVDRLQDSFPRHAFVNQADSAPEGSNHHTPVSPDSTAYLLFTSGSTGIPKGVAISQRNVTSYLHYLRSIYDVRPHDRFSQMFDMTFDLSVHDMFLCWTSGACLFCVPERSMMGPAKFIKENQLTMWFSVPSVVGFMQRLRMLKVDSFPTLRLSLFCGEPLLATMVGAWQGAAPNSLIENLYGPTEATIAIARYACDSKAEANKGVEGTTYGVVSIGEIFPTQSGCIINDKSELVSPGEAGELCLAGSQVTSGYLNDEQKTRDQFVKLPSLGERTWYRTGDVVRQSDDGKIQYLGRLDNQVQVRGHRVELQEVDHVLRRASGKDEAISLAWPIKTQQIDAIYAFVGTKEEIDAQQILDCCMSELPEYAVPRDVFSIERIPVNANGKVDRATLERYLEEILNGSH